MPLKWLTGTVTQGSADAFAEAEMSTGLSNVTRQAYRIRRIEFYVPAGLIGADCEVGIQLMRKSTAALNPNSVACIAGWWRKVELTTSGMFAWDVFPNAQTYSRDEDLVIVEETLYLDVDSTGTSLSLTVGCRIGYETRTITENERLGIQAQTASV
jgi:hypothetical protein